MFFSKGKFHEPLHIFIQDSHFKGAIKNNINIMQNGLFKVSWADAGRGLLVSVLAAIFVYILAILNAPGFSFNTIDFAEIARIALSSGIGYLAKQLLTDSQGNIAGIGSK